MHRLKFLGKISLKHHKNTAKMSAVVMYTPSEVLLPMSQHIGAAATPIVKVGDEVKVGQKIADASGKISSNIYSSVSGKVVKIEDYLTYHGKIIPAIRIESDGLMTVSEEVAPPIVSDLDSLICAVRNSGLVGLGGAGFPTDVKLEALKSGNIKYIILNGAECEPYITSDTRTMLDESEAIVDGVELLQRYAPSVERVIIGIEKNKSECIEKMRQAFEGNSKVTVSALPSKYPQGGEKILIYNTTGLVVKEGQLPSSVGVVVINVSTLAFISKYIKTGMPLVSRTITVDGSAISASQNVVVPLGTSIEDVIGFCGGFSGEVGKVLFGGTMMGIPAYSLKEPIVKMTNAIVALSRDESEDIEETECIHCGKCVDVCPMNLNPAGYSKALTIENKEEKIAALENYKVNICMECGCCSYVCPARRPLVQNSKIAKQTLKSHYEHLATLKK